MILNINLNNPNPNYCPGSILSCYIDKILFHRIPERFVQNIRFPGFLFIWNWRIWSCAAAVDPVWPLKDSSSASSSQVSQFFLRNCHLNFHHLDFGSSKMAPQLHLHKFLSFSSKLSLAIFSTYFLDPQRWLLGIIFSSFLRFFKIAIFST